MDPFWAYAFRSSPPADVVRFRRLVALDGLLGGITATCFLLYRPLDETRADLLPAQSATENGQQQRQVGLRPRGQDRRDERVVSVWHFLSWTVPHLLPQLSRTTQPQRVQMHGRVRGRIDWESTYKARYSEEHNPTIFVCQQSGRRYDRLENQLLKFLLYRIEACLEWVPTDIRSWKVWAPAQDGVHWERVTVRRDLAMVAHRLRRHQASAYLRDVELPDAIGEHHLLAARTAKNPLYADVSGLYGLYAGVAEATDWHRWVRALDGAAPLPNDDGVYHLLKSTTYRSRREV